MKYVEKQAIYLGNISNNYKNLIYIDFLWNIQISPDYYKRNS